MHRRTSHVKKLNSISIDSSSVLQIGDSKEVNARSNILAVQREKAIFTSTNLNLPITLFFPCRYPLLALPSRFASIRFTTVPAFTSKGRRTVYCGIVADPYRLNRLPDLGDSRENHPPPASRRAQAREEELAVPSVVGAVNINSNSGTVNFGDTLNISPKTASKTFSGSGGGNTGNVVNTINGANATNTLDPSIVDQPLVGNI